MSETVILKLGGSVITDKSGECAIDHARLHEVADELAARRASALVLVHGAGSCGHPEARRYRINDGLTRENVPGVYQTHAAVSSLNAAVVGALRDAGVEAIGIHPFDLALAEDGRLVSFETRHIAEMTEHGIVPVLHGDVVMDLLRGSCIVSGDQLVTRLAVALGSRRVGLATDVPGVLENGSIVPYIDRSRAASLAIGGSASTDVTGGMQGKIRELLALADAGTDAHIFHISKIGRFLDGTEHGGTIVTKRGRA
ncbi:isopentenyl phosphate kinase [Methanoculleus sp.]|uniref:isopentenyl phosphate kinase n=1 Tax=Methanoculleus sp. TaxID=90427 RepID=UPI0025CEBEDE|nr:isopentenyl phosphate kinase [Methanoculleus sp.]MCK9317960.1 isopentenyl phosphate kinase [Methanoculleus sp.]MDD2253976.1 isopentenyl phosphate kinase [Methanoculleus sp.]MDD2786682.1 isopentenyl phosphate kinase [Methanoculleus sp.]MDD3216482.1 isopentenyl phosphate kinase [Methanoculleus sp.]MDD4314445.1 isopentenyl phosphate kinase [Methanoculleus sp.]